jgi:hypothetical protein
MPMSLRCTKWEIWDCWKVGDEEKGNALNSNLSLWVPSESPKFFLITPTRSKELDKHLDKTKLDSRFTNHVPRKPEELLYGQNQ